MQLSIKQILDIYGSSRILGESFARAHFGKIDYADQTYSLTQDDVDAVARSLDERYQTVPQIGSIDLFDNELTPEQWSERRNEINDAMREAKRLFRMIGLDTPKQWLINRK